MVGKDDDIFDERKICKVFMDLIPTLLDWVFPAKACSLCRVSGHFSHQSPWCEVCEQKLQELKMRWQACDRCGKYMEPNRVLLCAECAEEFPAYAWGKAVGPYQGLYRRAVHQLKFSGQQILAGAMGQKMVQAIHGDSKYQRVDLIFPVPLTPMRERERGFHQTNLLAQVIGRSLQVPVSFRNLQRIRETLRQSELSREERIQNVQGAFRVAKPKELAGRQILLVDDVITTGATCKACAQILLEAGAGQVVVLAWAAGVGF